MNRVALKTKSTHYCDVMLMHHEYHVEGHCVHCNGFWAVNMWGTLADCREQPLECDSCAQDREDHLPIAR